MGEEGSPKTEMINPALLDGVSANFIVKGPSGVEKSYPMRQLSMSIGRSDQCDISVKDSSMSGKHCEISKINGEIKVRDTGSANGIWLNGERVAGETELFDGDVIRLGQTSIRIDVVGGRKRPDAGLSPRLLIGLIAGFVILAIVGVMVGITLKKRAQKKRDLSAVSSFVNAAREGQKSKPCSAVVDKVGDVAKTLGSLGKVSCETPPKGDDARRVVSGYRDLAKTYDRIVVSLNQFAGQGTSSNAALSGTADQIENPELKAKIAEAQELVDARSGVTQTFIADWKKLGQATSTYASQLDQALLQNNKNVCSMVDRGVTAKSAAEILGSCNRNFEKAKGALEEKLKEIEEVSGGGEAAAAE